MNCYIILYFDSIKFLSFILMSENLYFNIMKQVLIISRRLVP